MADTKKSDAAPAAAAAATVAVTVKPADTAAAADTKAAAATAAATPAAAVEEPYDCYYFGYGSNMSSRTLNRRNIHPAHSEPATLPGWRLAMNLKSSLAPLEPSFANVEKDADPANVCHGVLHRVTRSHVAQLEREEGGGQSYLREELLVVTYKGEKHVASVFVLPDSRAAMKCETPCSKRYIGLLLHGARESALTPAYIAKLEAMPTAPLPVLAEVMTEERKKAIAAREVTLDEVKEKGKGYLWMALKGVVLDLTTNTTFVAKIMGAQEKTLDMAKFLSDIECPAPASLDQLNARHKAYIDAALATMLLMQPIVGHVKGEKYDW